MMRRLMTNGEVSLQHSQRPMDWQPAVFAFGLVRKSFFSKTFVLSREETPRRGSNSNLAGAAFDLLNGTSAPR